MPELSNIEATLLDDLYSQAVSLENGHTGDMAMISSVVAKTAKVVVAMARTGGVSPAECKGQQERFYKRIEALVIERVGRSDWKAKLAVWLPLSGALLGLGLKVLSL
jgi:hypothetical protein